MGRGNPMIKSRRLQKWTGRQNLWDAASPTQDGCQQKRDNTEWVLVKNSKIIIVPQTVSV